MTKTKNILHLNTLLSMPRDYFAPGSGFHLTGLQLLAMGFQGVVLALLAYESLWRSSTVRSDPGLVLSSPVS